MDKVIVHVQDKILFSHESHSAIPDIRAGTRDQYLNKITQAQKDKCLIIYTYVQSEKVDLKVESRTVVTKG